MFDEASFPALLSQDRRGEQTEQMHLDDNRVIFKAVFPLNEIIVDFFDHLKSVTSGYARCVR